MGKEDTLKRHKQKKNPNKRHIKRPSKRNTKKSTRIEPKPNNNKQKTQT